MGLREELIAIQIKPFQPIYSGFVFFGFILFFLLHESRQT